MKTLLELEQARNVAFERRSWRVERVGWLGLALVVGATLLGVLGPGPLSTVHAHTPDRELEMSYPRFVRVRSSAWLALHLHEAGAREVRLWLDGPWLANVRVLGIVPAPTRSELTDGRWTLVFATSKVAKTDLEITLEVEPRSAGSLTGSVGLDSGAELRFHQLVYP